MVVVSPGIQAVVLPGNEELLNHSVIANVVVVEWLALSSYGFKDHPNSCKSCLSNETEIY